MTDLAKQGKLNQLQIMQPAANALPQASFSGPQGNEWKFARANAGRMSQFQGHLSNQPNAEHGEPRPRLMGAAAAAGRPTLTGGLTAGRIAGTPSALKNPSDETGERSSRRKSTPGDASMRRSIQDLVLSIDRNVEIDPETNSSIQITNFGCRLAKHRGGKILEVRDLQFHLGRNHNIRIPGYASDLTPTALSQMGVAPAPQGTQGMKKGTQGTQNSLRSHRLAQAKREAKLM
ncbi:hypothetical protein EDB86DRAFT_3079022 [Lactarius hatsudake]|nr:hypothetical protein EDB86DRAFT_3079022 [Lactarius hatsudake]